MATRTGKLSKPDKQGKYARQLGWKLNDSEKRVQHKFRLGTCKREAERRDDLLRRIWVTIEDNASQSNAALDQRQAMLIGAKGEMTLDTVIPKPKQPREALWDDDSLMIAKQVAQGARIVLPALENESDEQYATRIQRIQDRFTFLPMAPADEQKFARGKGDQATSYSDCVILGYIPPMPSEMEEKIALLRPTNDRDALTIWADYKSPLSSSPAGRPTSDGRTLYQAFDAYTEWIKKDKIDPETLELTDYAFTKIGQVETLRYRHENVDLSTIGYEEIEDMFRFWKLRPPKRTKNGDGDRIKPSSVKHYVGELYRMFKWLHRSKDFAWQKPQDFEEISRKTPKSAKQAKAKIKEVKTFNLEELRLLNRYATPFERLILLLGLNCGFGPKEIATLTIGEVSLHQALSNEEQETFDFPSSSNDSFLSLVRNKTVIVGKYLLFNQTTQMIEWAMSRRLKLPNPKHSEPLWISEDGNPLDKRSDNGNSSRQVYNTFQRLKKRIRNDGHEINDLPVKQLRKTGADFIRRKADGEAASVFLLHGKTLKEDPLLDIYTNRPFGKVYKALRIVEESLAPVFAEAPADPTKAPPQAYTKRSTIDKILQMKRDGKSVREIAESVGKSKSTVHRLLNRIEH